MKNKLATSIVFFLCFFTSVNTNAQDPDSVQNNESSRVTVTVNGNILSQRIYVYLYTQNEDSVYEELMPFEEYYFPGCVLISPLDMNLISPGDSVYCFLKVVTNTTKRKYVEQDVFFFPLEPKWFAGKGALVIDIILTKGKRGWSRDPNVGESWQGYPFKVVLHVGHLSIVMERGIFILMNIQSKDREISTILLILSLLLQKPQAATATTPTFFSQQSAYIR